MKNEAGFKRIAILYCLLVFLLLPLSAMAAGGGNGNGGGNGGDNGGSGGNGGGNGPGNGDTGGGQNGAPTHVCVDENADGVCDFFVDADGDGDCDGTGPQGSGEMPGEPEGKPEGSDNGSGQGGPKGPGNGQESGSHECIDSNADGVCDHFIDEDGDGVCDGRGQNAPDEHPGNGGDRPEQPVNGGGEEKSPANDSNGNGGNGGNNGNGGNSGNGGNQNRPGPETAKLDGFRVIARNCELGLLEDGSLSIVSTTETATVKIQRAGRIPVDRLTTFGVVLNEGEVAYLAGTSITQILVSGDLRKLSTVAPIGLLSSDASIGSISANDCAITSIEATTLRLIRMRARPQEEGAYTSTTILTTDVTTTAMRIYLSGVVLENLLTEQPVRDIKAGSKLYRSRKDGARWVSLGGVGRVMTTTLATWPEGDFNVVAGKIRRISVSAGNIAPDLIQSRLDIGKISARKAPRSVNLPGGIVGIVPGEDGAFRTTVIAPNIRYISGREGVYGIFIAGIDEEGTPDYSGSIGRIATHPTSGTIAGEAHVENGSTLLDFLSTIDNTDGFTVFDAQ